MIRRQLAQHARPDVTVLDAGCGQGTQAEAAGVQIELLDGSRPGRLVRVRVCQRDPYRSMASQLHIVGRAAAV